LRVHIQPSRAGGGDERADERRGEGEGSRGQAREREEVRGVDQGLDLTRFDLTSVVAAHLTSPARGVVRDAERGVALLRKRGVARPEGEGERQPEVGIHDLV